MGSIWIAIATTIISARLLDVFFAAVKPLIIKASDVCIIVKFANMQSNINIVLLAKLAKPRDPKYINLFNLKKGRG